MCKKLSMCLALLFALALASSCAGEVETPDGTLDHRVSRTLPTAERWLTERARPADSFVDSVGVNIHAHYTDTTYDKFRSILLPRIRQLGVRYVRDGAYTYEGIDGRSFYYRRLRKIAALGVKFDLITAMDTAHGSETRFTHLDDVLQWTAGAVSSFEGVNEPDLQDVGDWVYRSRGVQRALHREVSRLGRTGIDIIGPSPTTAEASSDLGDLSRNITMGNIHNYYSDRHPETLGWGSNGYGSLLWNARYVASPVSGAHRIVSTETGYSTSPTVDAGVPERVASVYLPRLLMTQFRAGIARTFLYELLDQSDQSADSEANFGLVRADGSPKPSFRALRNLLAFFKDPGAHRPTGVLNFSLGGETDQVAHQLLQRRDGTFQLALWVAKPVWDTDRDQRVAVPVREVDVVLPGGFSCMRVDSLTPRGSMRSRAIPGEGGSCSAIRVGARITILSINSPD